MLVFFLLLAAWNFSTGFQYSFGQVSCASLISCPSISTGAINAPFPVWRGYEGLGYYEWVVFGKESTMPITNIIDFYACDAMAHIYFG